MSREWITGRPEPDISGGDGHQRFPGRDGGRVRHNRGHAGVHGCACTSVAGVLLDHELLQTGGDRAQAPRISDEVSGWGGVFFGRRAGGVVVGEWKKEYGVDSNTNVLPFAFVCR